MNILPTEWLNKAAADWFETMSNLAWQSALVVLAATLLCQMLRHQSPAVRSWIWRIAAAKLLLIPFFSWTYELPIQPLVFEPEVVLNTPVRPSVEVQLVPAALPAPIASTIPAASPIIRSEPLSWSAWLMIIWIAVVSIHIVRVLLQWKSLRQLMRTQVPNLQGLSKFVEKLSMIVNLRQSPEVLTVDTEVSPFVCIARRPVLVLPSGLVNEIGLRGLQQIVLHELAHIRRGDLWWCWLPMIVRTVYWFNPLVHWMAYQDSLERELACDAAAINAANTTVADYAQTLVSAASRSVPLPALQATVNQLVGTKPIS